jgi:ureidoglycolate lyase
MMTRNGAMDAWLEPASGHAFAGLGELLETPHRSPRQDGAASVQNLRPGAAANLALIRSDPFTFAPVTTMERHRYSTQLFVPLDVDAYIVLVAGGEMAPDLGSLRALRVSGHHGINYLPGTWHMGMATLSRPGTFAMLIHEDGSAADCEFCDVPPIQIRITER